MKFLKYFLMIMCSVNLFLLAEDADEEVKTIEIDGVIFKINQLVVITTYYVFEISE